MSVSYVRQLAQSKPVEYNEFYTKVETFFSALDKPSNNKQKIEFQWGKIKQVVYTQDGYVVSLMIMEGKETLLDIECKFHIKTYKANAFMYPFYLMGL